MRSALIESEQAKGAVSSVCRLLRVSPMWLPRLAKAWSLVA